MDSWIAPKNDYLGLYCDYVSPDGKDSLRYKSRWDCDDENQE